MVAPKNFLLIQLNRFLNDYISTHTSQLALCHLSYCLILIVLLSFISIMSTERTSKKKQKQPPDVSCILKDTYT